MRSHSRHAMTSTERERTQAKEVARLKAAFNKLKTEEELELLQIISTSRSNSARNLQNIYGRNSNSSDYVMLSSSTGRSGNLSCGLPDSTSSLEMMNHDLEMNRTRTDGTNYSADSTQVYRYRTLMHQPSSSATTVLRRNGGVSVSYADSKVTSGTVGETFSSVERSNSEYFETPSYSVDHDHCAAGEEESKSAGNNNVHPFDERLKDKAFGNVDDFYFSAMSSRSRSAASNCDGDGAGGGMIGEYRGSKSLFDDDDEEDEEDEARDDVTILETRRGAIEIPQLEFESRDQGGENETQCTETGTIVTIDSRAIHKSVPVLSNDEASTCTGMSHRTGRRSSVPRTALMSGSKGKAAASSAVSKNSPAVIREQMSYNTQVLEEKLRKQNMNMSSWVSKSKQCAVAISYQLNCVLSQML